MLVPASAPRPGGALPRVAVALLAAALLAHAPVEARTRKPDPAKTPAPSPAPAPAPTPAPSPAPAEKTTPATAPPPGEASAPVPYVFFVDASTVIKSATAQEVEQAQKLRAESEGKVLWFRKDGKEYALRDPAVLQSILDLQTGADKSRDHVRTMARKDGEMSQQMDQLVKEQEDLNQRLDALADERTRLEAAPADGKGADNAQALERLAAQETELNKQLDQKDEEMEHLADSIDTLSADKDRAREEGTQTASKTEGQIRTILDQSLRSGAAKRYRPKT